MKKLILGIVCLIIEWSAQAQIKVDELQGASPQQKYNIGALPHVPLDSILIHHPNLIYKFRLDSIQKTVPLDYNEYVQHYIDTYVNRKSMYAKMLALSDFYFPIFEKALKTYQVPVEIKYLPIIESALNPHAVSRVGATGIWQFMFGTAKGYGLNMDNFIDERKDPIQASYAAAAYFKDAYDELGDWLLAIAAYNCGKGNVNRAIEKAGSRNFWEIRDYLPSETRNYVPAYIAAMYVMKYAKTHQITPEISPFNFKTDTVLVRNFVALTDLAKAMGKEEETLNMLNPAYKKGIVNGTDISPKRIVIPRPQPQYFPQIFEVLNTDFETEKDVVMASTDDVRELRKNNVSVKNQPSSRTIIHKVQPGQNLTLIANKYKVEVQDLRVWNRLKGNTIIPGQQLKIYRDNKTGAPIQKIDFSSYRVKPGDTLYSIAEKFEGITVSSLKKANNLQNTHLQIGMVLKIM